MAGLLITSIGSGLPISRFGRYKVFPVPGHGDHGRLLLLSRMGASTGMALSSLYMFVLGVGLGSVLQVLGIAVQNAVDYKDLGAATSGVTFFRSMGGSFGTAVFGAIFANLLVGNLKHDLAGAKHPAGLAAASVSPAALARLPAAAHAGYVQAYAHSLQVVPGYTAAQLAREPAISASRAQSLIERLTRDGLASRAGPADASASRRALLIAAPAPRRARPARGDG